MAGNRLCVLLTETGGGTLFNKTRLKEIFTEWVEALQISTLVSYTTKLHKTFNEGLRFFGDQRNLKF